MAETQADKLAAALLMPRFIVEIALTDFNSGNRIWIFVTQVFVPEERTTINKMAAQIGVSYTALLIRLKQLGMLEYHPLEEYLESGLFTEPQDGSGSEGAFVW